MATNNPLSIVLLCSVFLLLFDWKDCNAQIADPSQLTIEKVFSSNDYRPEFFGKARWIEDGEAYTTLEPSSKVDGFRDIVRYQSANGVKEVLVSADQLKSGSRSLWISDYDWSPDKTYLIIFTNTKRVWRVHSKGDYWLLHLKSGKLQQLGVSVTKPSSMMFAKFSPDSKSVAYVSGHNIYIEDIDTNEVKQMTFSGNQDIINGTFDWAYEEEFGIRDGFRWSPDSKSIAFWQLDATKIRDFYMINTTDSIYSYTIPIQYPKVGQDNSACRLGVVSAVDGSIVWMQLEGDPKQNYIPRMGWADNSTEILFQYLNRKQNTNRLMLGDIKNGKVSTVFTDRDEAWLDVVDDLKWLKGGSQFTWVSEKEGWRQVYIISKEGKLLKKVTPWEMDVISIEKIDERKGWLYFIASPTNATQRYLYRCKLNGKGNPKKLSPQNQPGTHSYQISPNGKWAIHNYSNANTPSTTSIISLPDHKTVTVKVANTKLKKRLNALERNKIEFFKITTKDNIELDAYMLKPVNFDASKKYPVLFHVYGEPWGTTVADRWSGNNYLWHLMLAQQGYIIMSIDNRGTRVPKGREFRKCVYGKIGILASEDQANGLKAIIDKYSFVDENRIGIWGWSGGGSMTLNMLFRYPELYHVGMSVAPVSNQLLYDNIYQERYMGLPWENREGYKNGSPITHAKNLKGKLLLIHGTGDDNVHYQNTELLINELVRHNKIFSLMSYPNRSHGIYEGENTSRHLRTTLTHFLKNNLPAGPR